MIKTTIMKVKLFSYLLAIASVHCVNIQINLFETWANPDMGNFTAIINKKNNSISGQFTAYHLFKNVKVFRNLIWQKL